MHAHCRVGVYHGERLPDPDCSCGIYAASLHAEELVTQYAIQAHVVGTVSMWGRIVEHEYGARSEFAYPSQLAVICELCSIENRSLVAAERMLEIPAVSSDDVPRTIRTYTPRGGSSRSCCPRTGSSNFH